ncbi:MSHA biogenesis protein MshG [Noviherbaspirillum humi]|uniref:MSHA biogenesis protein MshG n=1 Tax=Noviherbaspirillum humi TaxID=1688639 RepID=A0A239HMZ2_9BURK|nr:type II secretion system F family protein [Noviherbaspirillum humi]SNS82692.1 MSHA biogenesis protein MshG [Noviherbaspirillum humi]
MASYHYRARNSRGELMQGVVDGADSGAVAAYLVNIGAIPIDIKLEKARSESGRLWEKLTDVPVTTLDVQLFCRQMYTLLKAGVPIMQALDGLRDSATNKSFGRVIGNLRESLNAGQELSAAMRAHAKVFSSYFISMVQVGEITGRLSEIFPRLHDYLEFDRSMREQVKAALQYPKFVMLAMIGAMSVVNLMVIPRFATIFSKAKIELPLMTRVLLNSSSFMTNNWPILLGLALLAVIGWNAWVKSKDGRYTWDKAKLGIPIAGPIIHKAVMARFARSLALAQQSGIPASQALSIVSRTVDNSYIGSAVEQMRDGVERGETILKTAKTTGVFTPIVLQMIAVGEESGDIDGLMNEIADMYEREVKHELKMLSTKIEPLMLSFMAVLVLVLALGVFVPMWDMSQLTNVQGR